jgi:hypothetical protein
MKEEAKGILSRLGLVIHWFGFVLGIFFSALSFFMMFKQSPAVFGIPLSFLFFNGFGWLIRFILSGKNHFLPYK